MILQSAAGAGYLLRGLSLLGRPGIKRFVAIPLAVNVLVFALLLGLAVDQFGALTGWMMAQLPDWLAWLAWLLWILFGLAAAVLVFFSFSIIANILAAPFNGILAEAVERHLTGRTADDTSTGMLAALKDAPGAVWGEFRKLGYFARWAVLILLLFLVPGVNLLAPFAWLLFSAWMLALEYGDYPMGNHGLRPPAQRSRLARQRGYALGFGGAVLVATTIPLVNFLVMPAAVAGATAMWVERFKDEAG